jgi:hypothetical protein
VAFTVTPYEDMVPSPRVDVLVEAGDLNGSTVSVTVWQISDAGEFPVRGAQEQPSSGGLFVTDYEVPRGIPVSYKVEEFNSAGTRIAFGLEASTQLTAAPGTAVIQDPLAPGNAVLVRAAQGTAASLKYTRDAKVYRAGNATLALLGERGLLEDVPLRCWTDVPADRDRLGAVLAETQFLVRCSPDIPVPPVFHVIVPSPVRTPFDYAHGGTTDVWDMQATQVSRSEIDILVPTINYDTFNAAFATYTEFNAFYSTYLNAISNPPPAP